jgi:histidyl-tRNA synthetase
MRPVASFHKSAAIHSLTLAPLMSKNKPSLPQGTRDFDPVTVRKRRHIFDTIRTVFELYGYQPLETPAMEQLDTLMGKYGEEGDKLIFKILNNGLGDPKNVDRSRAAFENVLRGKNDPNLTERALRYDLTIPFARFVAMNHGQLTFPFRRYQMQPVWRADRPQKGRYREFYQCDADVVGSNSLLNEVELAAIYNTVFQRLGIVVEIRVNHRKILQALAAASSGSEDHLIAITTAIDKLDKIGLEKVIAELVDRGLNADQVSIIEKYLAIDGANIEKLAALRSLFAHNVFGSELAEKGIADLEFLLNYPGAPPLVIDLTLARGLNYYTGIIFEVGATGVQMGSIGGGGRYDDLTGTFGVPGIPGVGISFGVDRTYDVMEDLGLFPAGLGASIEYLFFNLGEQESRAAYTLLQQLRAKGISGELYHEPAKFDKQFKYAEKKGARYAVIIGGEELAAGRVSIKDLQKRTQTTISFEEFLLKALPSST